MEIDKIKKRRKIKKGKTLPVFIFTLGFILGNIVTNIFLAESGNVTRIYIVYSSEKASWMAVTYANFMEEWNKKHPDERIIIDMHPYGSADSVISILNGEIFPTIWSPASSIWIPFLNAKWEEYKGTEKKIVELKDAIRIIYSPIVIATWEDFNKSYTIHGFLDLYNLIKDNEVNVKMAHTDPRLSNSGFLSVIMALSAAIGKNSKDLKMDDLTDEKNQDWLKTFESCAVMYGKSTGFLAKYMSNGGPNTLNVAFLYENLIRDISNTAKGGKIIAIYPKEGTLYSDHPFCLLNADWITPKQREVAEEFLAFLNRTDTIKSAIQYGFRPIDTSIPLDPDIFNYETSGIKYNLTIPELEVPEDGTVLSRIPDMWLLCKANA